MRQTKIQTLGEQLLNSIKESENLEQKINKIVIKNLKKKFPHLSFEFKPTGKSLDYLVEISGFKENENDIDVFCYVEDYLFDNVAYISYHIQP